MAYTTYAAFVTAVASISITGVARSYTSPPPQIAELPASYPRLPQLEREVVAFGGASGIDNGTVEIVFLIESAMQNLNSTNFATMTALVDTIDTAYAANTLSAGIDRWTIRQEQEEFGDTVFWALVATVEGSG